MVKLSSSCRKVFCYGIGFWVLSILIPLTPWEHWLNGKAESDGRSALLDFDGGCAVV